MGKKMSMDEEDAVVAMFAAGATYEVMRDTIGRSNGAIQRVINERGGMTARSFCPSNRHLSMNQREDIRAGVERGDTGEAIAATVGVHPSTVSRELARHGGRDRYVAWAAHRQAALNARRPKITKLEQTPELAAVVTDKLEDGWSPQQISGWLHRTYEAQPTMWVSHEAIYQSIYVQGRGALRAELHTCLRSGRARRLPNSRPRPGSRTSISGMVNISERPAEVEDRAVPGHWEGDLIIGKNNKSQIATLVERTTRFVMLCKVDDKRAETVRDAVAAKINTLPAALARTLTWDQGTEMAGHKELADRTSLDVYFCDPHSPWQRGTNENTNGLLRQYFPKGTDLSVHDQAHLDSIADLLNGRPRQTLGFANPAEKLSELLVALTD